MLSNALIAYLKKTNEEKQELKPNIRKQYDFQIREKVVEAISHLNLLLSSHSEEQLKKIFTEDCTEDFLKIVEAALDINGVKPDNPSWNERLRNHIIHLLQYSIPKEHYTTVLQTVMAPQNYSGNVLELEELKAKIIDLEGILVNHGIAGEELKKEFYIQRASKHKRDFEEQLRMTLPGSDKYIQIQNLIKHFSRSWEEYKKNTLNEISRLEDLKKKVKTEVQTHNLEHSIRELRKQIE
jgi:hypothetical protein